MRTRSKTTPADFDLSVPISRIRKSIRKKCGVQKKEVIAWKKPATRVESSAESHKTGETMTTGNLGPLFSGIVPFCRKDPSSWFRQLEANFFIHKIDDDGAKYTSRLN